MRGNDQGKYPNETSRGEDASRGFYYYFPRNSWRELVFWLTVVPVVTGIMSIGRGLPSYVFLIICIGGMGFVSALHVLSRRDSRTRLSSSARDASTESRVEKILTGNVTFTTRIAVIGAAFLVMVLVVSFLPYSSGISALTKLRYSVGGAAFMTLIFIWRNRWPAPFLISLGLGYALAMALDLVQTFMALGTQMLGMWIASSAIVAFFVFPLWWLTRRTEDDDETATTRYAITAVLAALTLLLFF